MIIEVESSIVRRVKVEAENNLEAIEKSHEYFLECDVPKVEGVEAKYSEPFVRCSYPIVEPRPIRLMKVKKEHCCYEFSCLKKSGDIQYLDGSWNVSCEEGEMWSRIYFCPFCGSRLGEPNE
jgi:hypothetical protein